MFQLDSANIHFGVLAIYEVWYVVLQEMYTGYGNTNSVIFLNNNL